MWISRNKWKEMEARVFDLECGRHKYCDLAHAEPRLYVPPHYSEGVSFTVTEAVRAILDHFGLQIEKTKSEVRLVKAPKK